MDICERKKRRRTVVLRGMGGKCSRTHWLDEADTNYRPRQNATSARIYKKATIKPFDILGRRHKFWHSFSQF